jgi:hypothetical protein
LRAEEEERRTEPGAVEREAGQICFVAHAAKFMEYNLPAGRDVEWGLRVEP